MSDRSVIFLCVLIASCAAVSCSTVSNIPEGEYRLTGNSVNITNRQDCPGFEDTEVSWYIIQKPNSYFFQNDKGGWNPFIAVYNWENGRGGGWDRFVHKIGQKPVVLDESLVDKSDENITRHLEYLGFYNSEVKGVIVPKGDRKAYVRYDVTLGRRYPIRSVEYDICDTLLASDYLADTTANLIKKGSPLSESLLLSESTRAAAMLRNKGWYDFSQNYFFFEADTTLVPDSSIVRVSIMNHTRNESEKSDIRHRKYRFGEVNIYPVTDAVKYRTALSLRVSPSYDTLRYKGVNILYDGKRSIKPSVVAAMNTIRTGDIYSENATNTTYQRYSNIRSFSSVSVELEKSDTGTVDCGIILLPPKLHGYKLELEASLNSSGLFGIAPALSYYNRNIFHGGEWFSLSTKGNFQFKFNDPTRAVEVGVAAGLSLPTFLLLPDRIFRTVVPRTDFNLTYNYQQRTEYTRNMIGATFGYSWNTSSGKWMFKLNPIQSNIVRMSDVSDDFWKYLISNPTLAAMYESHFELGCGGTVNYASVPGMNPKVSHFRAYLSMDLAGNILSLFNGCMPAEESGARSIWGSPYSQFLRTEGSFTYTWRFGRDNRHALAARAVAGIGIAYGNSTALPYERQFWVGGASSMRGWQSKSLGPGGFPYIKDLFDIPSQTGDIKLEANIEYRFPIVWKLDGALFADWGNVWERNGTETDVYDSGLTWNTLLKRSALDSGFGVRLDLSVVVVRLDLGIKLYDPCTDLDTMDMTNLRSIGWKPVNTWFTDGGCALQFGIGYPF